jgi:pyruvyltransferase
MALLGTIGTTVRRALPVSKPCLYYWRPRQGTNFGDELSLHVVTRLLHNAGLPAPRRCRKPGCPAQRLFAIGSILHDCRRGDAVWGSGINGKISIERYAFAGVDFRAVRGPLTMDMVRKLGGRCPPVFGDPGLLVSHLFPETRREAATDGKVALMPNLNDGLLYDSTICNGLEVEIISPNQEWRTVAASIQAASFVVSSSLHGIVLSDAYGIPCRPLRSLFEAAFKYEDYFLATGRGGLRFAHSVSQAMDLGPVPAPQIDLEPLLRAFPLDLFSKERRLG